MKLFWYLISFTKFYWSFQTNCYRFVIQGKKTLLNRLHIGYSYLTHSFILRKEEVPVCVECNGVITVKHISIECADLLEIRKKYFEEKSLYSLFRNVIPEMIFLFLARDWCVLQNMKCVKEIFVWSVFKELCNFCYMERFTICLMNN